MVESALTYGLIQRSIVPVKLFKLLPIEFVACSKPPNRDNYRKASYTRTQQSNQGVCGTQTIRIESS